jgi:hypothetical protein
MKNTCAVIISSTHVFDVRRHTRLLLIGLVVKLNFEKLRDEREEKGRLKTVHQTKSRINECLIRENNCCCFLRLANSVRNDVRRKRIDINFVHIGFYLNSSFGFFIILVFFSSLGQHNFD